MKQLILALFLIWGLSFCKTVYADNQVEVKITEGGFNPPSLTIDKDTVVKFINQDQVDRWPASDIHPTHTIYPEFDPKKPIKPGEIWKFRIQRSGQFRYHDHLKPHQRGMINVTPVGDVLDQTKKEKSSVIEYLKNFFSRLQAIFKAQYSKKLGTQINFLDLSLIKQQRVLKDISLEQGSDQAWKFFLQSYKGQAGSSGNIHDLAHFIGGLIFDQKKFGGLKICTPDFAFGCYHGFLDKAFETGLDKLTEAEKGCLSVGPSTSGPFSSCIHGIGHGIASFNLTADLKKSLASCENLTAGAQYCYDGVFMEFARFAAPNFYQAENPLYPCDDVEARYVFSCGRNQPNVLMQRFNYNFNEVVDLCLGAQNEDFKLACFDSLGFLAASSSLGKAEGILDSCNKIEDLNFRAKCATAAAGELIFQDVLGWREEAPKVCDHFALANKASCQNYLQQIIRDYHRT